MTKLLFTKTTSCRLTLRIYSKDAILYPLAWMEEKLSLNSNYFLQIAVHFLLAGEQNCDNQLYLYDETTALQVAMMPEPARPTGRWFGLNFLKPILVSLLTDPQR